MSTPTTRPSASDLTGSDERIETRAGPDVDDPLALLQPAQLERVPDARERVDRVVRQTSDGRGVVAQPGREWSSGVKMKRPVRRERNVSILCLHLLAQHLGVDRQTLDHHKPPSSGRRCRPIIPRRPCSAIVNDAPIRNTGECDYRASGCATTPGKTLTRLLMCVRMIATFSSVKSASVML